MKDRVPLYPGRVKLTLVSGQENTYDMVRADEPTQEGDPLSKATFLKDDTAALFGLDATAVPDDALAVLSRLHKGLGNEYVWEKNKHIENWTEYENVNLCASNGNTTIYYGTTKYLGNQMACGNVSKFTSACAGFYFKIYGSDTLYYGDPNGTCTISNGYFVFPAKTFISESDEISYVNSPDPNSYPPTVSDGYTYTALGQLGSAARVEILTYTGANQTTKTITFSNTPKIVLIFTNRNNTTYYVPSVYVWGYPRIFKAKAGASGTSYNGLSETYYMVKATTSGNSLTLEYTTDPSYNLFNDSFETYTVVAIG